MFDEEDKCKECGSLIGKAYCDFCGKELLDDKRQFDIDWYGGKKLRHGRREFCSLEHLKYWVEQTPNVDALPVESERVRLRADSQGDKDSEGGE